MDNVLIDDTYLKAIADSIRTKLNVLTKFKPLEMVDGIDTIASGSGNTFVDIQTDSVEPIDIASSDQRNDEVLIEKAFNGGLSGTTSIIDLFLKRIRSISFPDSDVESGVVTPNNSNYLFSNPNIETIYLNGLNTSATTSMNYMCSECKKLTKFNFGRAQLNSLTSCRYAFEKCYSLTDVIFTQDTHSANLTDMAYMFYQCTALKQLDLTHLDMSHSPTIGYMFYGCTSLISVILPTTTTKLYSSGSNNCPFYNCTSLQSLTILATNPPVLDGTYLFGENGTYNTGMKILVPQESVEAYKTASKWSTYADIIEGI